MPWLDPKWKDSIFSLVKANSFQPFQLAQLTLELNHQTETRLSRRCQNRVDLD